MAPVISAFHLDNFVTSRKSLGRANRAHGRLSPGIAESHLLQVRHPLAQHLCQPGLDFQRSSISSPLDQLTRNFLGYPGVRMPMNQRFVVIKKVEVLIAVNVGYSAT